ncbi:MAG: ABC transporter permease subunit [Oligoflexia bacterium]|nr:ABC transporter permease subunit [Oligoflexia bacterium]
MRVTLAIARRELHQYFDTPMGWLCLCGFVLVTGVFFALILTDYSVQATQAGMNPYMTDQLSVNDWVIQPFFTNLAIIFLLICPALSMRLLAEDRRQRSMEMLLSSPIGSGQIVVGKYLGALGFLVVMMASTLHYSLIMYWLGDPDPGVLAANYAGSFLLAASFLAVGMLASAFTESQVVALVISFGGLLTLWVLSWADSLAPASWGQILADVSMLSHQEELSKGLLHTKDVAYYISFIGFFLFATWQRVESWRWQ